MATILYARVSTLEQTIEHQEAHAKAAGFAIDETVADNGVSGVNSRLAERPEGKRLFDKLRAGDVLVVRWVDRLGRNYEDVCDTIRAFMRRGVVIRTVINNFTFDGSTADPIQQAVRDALIGFMAATATSTGRGHQGQPAGRNRARQVPHRLAVSWQKAGLHAGAVHHGSRQLSKGTTNVAQIAHATGVRRQTVYRLKADPAAAEAALAAWGL